MPAFLSRHAGISQHLVIDWISARLLCTAPGGKNGDVLKPNAGYMMTCRHCCSVACIREQNQVARLTQTHHPVWHVMEILRTAPCCAAHGHGAPGNEVGRFIREAVADDVMKSCCKSPLCWQDTSTRSKLLDLYVSSQPRKCAIDTWTA